MELRDGLRLTVNNRTKGNQRHLTFLSQDVEKGRGSDRSNYH
ncbi:MAG: hypothetical protein PUP90_13800 [Nostoc sp. S4]|nr:hypothetical protein [Nostoc sp. S4]